MAPVAVKEVNGVVPPTAPVKATVPVPAVRLKVCAPLMVVEAVMFAPTAAPEFVVSAATAPVKETGPVQVMVPPFVVWLPPKLINVDPVKLIAPVVCAEEVCVTVAPLTVKEESGVAAPTAPVKAIVPVPPVNDKLWAPSIVLLKEMFAPPPVTVLTVTGPVRVTGPVIVTIPLVVVWLPPKLINVGAV